MAMRNLSGLCALAVLICVAALTASAQSFQVQCPSTPSLTPIRRPTTRNPCTTGPTSLSLGSNGYLTPTANVNGAIKCQQIAGGDGFATMGDGTQTYLFAFGPLSGLADLAKGWPGTEFPASSTRSLMGLAHWFPAIPPQPTAPRSLPTSRNSRGLQL